LEFDLLAFQAGGALGDQRRMPWKIFAIRQYAPIPRPHAHDIFLGAKSEASVSRPTGALQPYVHVVFRQVTDIHSNATSVWGESRVTSYPGFPHVTQFFARAVHPGEY